MAKPKKSPTSINSDLASFLKVQSSKKPAKKNSVPRVADDDSQFWDIVHNAIKEANDAQAIADAKKKDAVEKARSIYEAHAHDGQFSKSLNFEGSVTAGVMITFKDDFRVVIDGQVCDDQDKVIEAIGQELFNKYFEQKRKVVVKKTDDKSLAVIREKLGDALFGSLFEVTLGVGTKDDMDRKQFDAPEEVRALLKQVSTAVRPR